MSIWRRLAKAVPDLSIEAQIGSLLGGWERAADRRDRLAPQPDSELPFTVGVIALSAKMAKADGTVSTYEVSAFKQAFKVSPGEMREAAPIFNAAKHDASDHAAYAQQLATALQGNRKLLEDVLDGLFHIAKADDELHPEEERFLAEVAKQFGFTAAEFASIKARHLVAAERDPFAVLGVDRSAGGAALEDRYRALLADCEPAALAARGVPQEFAETIAGEKRAALTQAYEAIKSARA
jgi:DnaJ like chaperone protein